MLGDSLIEYRGVSLLSADELIEFGVQILINMCFYGVYFLILT
jgi:hypothetical protein